MHLFLQEIVFLSSNLGKNMIKVTIDNDEFDLIINALQTWKYHTQSNLDYRAENGWDNQEQIQRIQAIDDLSEKLFAEQSNQARFNRNAFNTTNSELSDIPIAANHGGT